MMIEEDLGLPLTRDAMTRDSIWLIMYPSRLLSCPTYFWYSRGMEETSKGVPQVGGVPIRHHGLAVRIQAEPEDEDDVVQNGGDFRIVVARDQVVGQLDGVLGRRLRGVDRPST